MDTQERDTTNGWKRTGDAPTIVLEGVEWRAKSVFSESDGKILMVVERVRGPEHKPVRCQDCGEPFCPDCDLDPVVRDILSGKTCPVCLKKSNR